MANKQTAVEWLMDKLPMVDNNDPYLAEIIEQAKSMEQEQLAKAAAKGADEAVEALWKMMNDRD